MILLEIVLDLKVLQKFKSLAVCCQYLQRTVRKHTSILHISSVGSGVDNIGP